MNKGIWAGLVAIAFVAGSITTGTMAYAASNAQGQPFQQLEQKITQLQDQIGEFVVDSFFDVMYEITVPSCPDGERPTLNEDNDDYTCVPRESNDSFFDITVDTKQQLETEIVALGLHSSDPDAHHVPDNLGNHRADQNLDMKEFDIENANAILANDLLHSGNNIVAVGSITSGDSVTAANSVLTPGFVRGEQICIGDDCRGLWPASDNLGNHMAEQNLNMKRFDIENANAILANDLLHSGNNIVAVGSITAGNEITAANSVFSPGFVKGGQLCIGDDCRSSWPAGSGPITGSDIVDGSITSVDIAANTITASDLAASSVGTSELASHAVTRAKLAQDGCATNQILSWNGAEWICTDIEAPFSSLYLDGGTGLFRGETREVNCPRGQVLTGLQIIAAGTDSVVSIGFNPKCSPITP